MRTIYSVLLITALMAHNAFADPKDEAQQLKTEALEILKANAQRQASPEEYASCIYKLERAQTLLDQVNDNDSPLAQEVSSGLFWARRFANLQVINALEKLRKAGGTQPVAPARPQVVVAPPPPQDTAAPDPDAPELPASQQEAKKAFQDAEKFMNSHHGDDYAIALRWFQMANEHPGSDYSITALELARAAQTRFAAKSKPATNVDPAVPAKPETPATPEMKMVQDGDKLLAAGSFDEAMALYTTSLKLKDTADGRRAMGNAFFRKATKMKSDLLPKLEVAEDAYRKAYAEAWETRRLRSGGTYKKFNPRSPAYVTAARDFKALCDQALVAISIYDKAQSEFKSVLRLAPNNKDLEAAGNIGVCMSVRGDSSSRSSARSYLNKFLLEYTPTTDLERSTYEFCKTELARINAPPKKK